MADLYQGITIFGLNALDGTQLYGVLGSPIPTSGSPAESSGVIIAGLDNFGNLQAISTDNQGRVNVNASITPPSDNTATGAITSTQTVPVSTQGTSALQVQIEGVWTGDLAFEITLDGTNWQAIRLYPAIPNGNPATSTTSTNGNWTIPVGGIRDFRVRGNSVVSGTANVFLTAGQGQYSVFNYSDDAANFLATSWTNDGAGNPISSTTEGSPATTGLNVHIQNASPIAVVTSGTVSVTQGTSPWVDNITQWASTVLGAPTAFGTVPTGNVIGVNSAIMGTSGFQANVTAGGALLVDVVNTGNTFTVAGNLTNNNAAPAADNVGVLPAVANAAPVTYTEGDQVLLSTDLAGNLRTNANLYANGLALSTTTEGSPSEVSLNVHISNTAPITVDGTVTVSGTVSVTQGTTPWVTRDQADGTPGAAVPGTAIQVAGSDGTNLQTIKTTTAGTQVVIPADQAEATALNWYSADGGSSPVTVTTTPTPVFSVESNSGAVTFLLRGFNFFTNGTQARYQIIKNGTLTGATFAASVGSANVDTAATVISGGTVIESGYTGTGTIVKEFVRAFANGTPGDHFTLVANSISGTSKVLGSLQWSEQTTSL